jgi:hypothetical protein
MVIVGSPPLELLPLLLLLPLPPLELPPSWPPPLLLPLLLPGLLLLLHATAVANTPIPSSETRVVSFIVASGVQA